MRRNYLVNLGWVGLVITTALTVEASPVPVDKSWERVSSSDGITTYSKEISGAPTVAFLGEALIDAPVAKVAQVLIDTARKTEWVSDAMITRDIRQISQLERIEYNRTHAPWPIKNRDFVLRCKLELDQVQKTATVTFSSVPDPAQPETDEAVRGKVTKGSYIMKSMEGGTKTWVQVEILADPMGAVPKWAVNLVQRSWPRKTLTGIQRQVAKPDVIENPEVKAFFEGKLDAYFPVPALPTSVKTASGG